MTGKRSATLASRWRGFSVVRAREGEGVGVWGVEGERVRIVFRMGSGEVMSARWSWWRTELRSCLDNSFRGGRELERVVRSPCLDLVNVLRL